MAAKYTEVVSSTGWGGNVKRRGKGAIIGILLFILAFPLLWWNKGQLKEQHEGLDWLKTNTVSIDPREAAADTDGQSVHMIGTPQTDETISDQRFGLALNSLLRLKREVEMFQWKKTETTRTEDTAGGGSRTVKEYTYDRVWSEQFYDSSGFRYADKHPNPPTMEYQSRWHNAQNASFGVFRLEQNVIGQLDETRDLPLGGYSITPPEGFQLASETYLFRGAGSLNSPQIGDYRTVFRYVALDPISMIARQSGNRLQSVRTANNLEYLLVGQGQFTAEDLIEKRRGEEELKAWIIRAVGMIMMAIGVQSVFALLGSLLGFIPFVRGLAGGIGFIAGVMVAITLGSLTIAMAWLAARPVFAMGLLAVAATTLIAGGFFGRRKVKQNNSLAKA
ncbi:MAG: TMEM43 family protein [Alphaproteobacteria bacterium]|nr:TMEM43 family protein [Alphaproteobacteria bacterium SS10]